MLVYFKVGNFKSIKDPVVINFAASSITEHQDSNVLEKGKLKLLKSVLLYGPNAGGKSKILDAFVIFRGQILDSGSHNSKAKLPVMSFELNESTKKQPSLFEAEFIIKNKRYRYGFEADENAVTKEWLLEVKATTESAIFLRINQQFKVELKKLVNAEGVEKKCNPNVLFLSAADQWNVPLAKQILGWFSDIFTIHGVMDQEYTNYTNDMMSNSEYEPQINAMLKQADLGISSAHVIDMSENLKKRLMSEAPDQIKEQVKHLIEQKSKRVYLKHNVFDDLGNVVGDELFSLENDESEGTIKFYNIIGSLLYAIKNGHMVVIDELDAKLHSLLTKAILRLFNSDVVKSESQLFAACHDTAVLDRNLIRRDQVYIVEKNRLASTTAVNLVEYKVRKESPLDKNYLEGKFGGIPFIKNLENALKNE